MMQLTTKPALNKFLIALENNPQSFKEVYFITPFLEFCDDHLKMRWHRILAGLKKAKVVVNLITRKKGTRNHCENIKTYLKIMRNDKPFYSESLHSKMYLAIGKKKNNSIGLLTSANLSNAALFSNLETTLYFANPYSKADIDFLDKFYKMCKFIKIQIRKNNLLRRKK